MVMYLDMMSHLLVKPPFSRPYAFFPIAGAGHGAWGRNKTTGLNSCVGPACGNLLDADDADEDHVAYAFIVKMQKLTVVRPLGPR